MRISAQILFIAFFPLVTLFVSLQPAYAQTSMQSASNINSFSPNTDSNVPQNGDTYAQETLIDVTSAFMCQLTGVDTTNPQQPCLGVNPSTGKIGIPSVQNSQTFGQAQTQPQPGGALGLMTGFISSLYIPPVSTKQYVDYLTDNFGIVHRADAYLPAVGGIAGGDNGDCSPTFGYGFCGLTPIFSLWTGIRDFAYALLTILFIAIGIGVMLRFRVDPRTVMTLQNQIPRVIIAILLITFSYAIAGVMIDLMWTVTYAGINFITNVSDAQVAINCPAQPQPLSHVVEQRLLTDPFNFTDTVFRGSCENGSNENGLFSLTSDVAASLGTLVTQAIETAVDINPNSCGFDINLFHDIGCVAQSAAGTFLIWFTEQLVKLVLIVALLIALFRLWWQLIKAYITFLIFVIMGPLWIVMGLVPGRPLGFEKWIRIIFANLAVFPLVAFLLVFARVITDVPQNVNPQTSFVPPLIGNPSVSTFTSLLGLGAILLAPSIPELIKERMKATGGAKHAATIAAGIGIGASAAMSPGKKLWEAGNRFDSQTGQPLGAIAIGKQKIIRKLPIIGTRYEAHEKRRSAQRRYYAGYTDKAPERPSFYRQKVRDEKRQKPQNPPQGGGRRGGSGGRREQRPETE